ncbi:hypothetical protein COS12_01225 [Candidatus Roizmanbacteria bacterium CG01_land_8_20_14_3_00_33_9]|uniref:Polyprenyl synthetase family protein n=2 Tax=Candidatus Roizmaniibacteriota TaxID=1752723 RepID=A0A2M7E4V4_9BACT|nr:MAG: hypothetical protein COS12_01225 [Candidatus Roizmanbacteria bacterium CG01_land_8_20_14_3_00_33_9]
MKLFGYFETVKPLLVKQINKFFLQQKDFPNKQLLQSLQAFNLKGKLLRGMLVLLINKMEGGQINEKVLNVATAMELAHSGLLIHDDIMDKDLFRRGFPTIHKSFGQSMAICAGDWLFCKAIELIDDNELIKIMSVGVQQVMHGQILDVFFSETNNNPNQSTILDIYRKKTAFYSFSLPFKLGAMLQKASLKKLDILNSLGENLGLIFQIKDDEMGIFGDEKATGKPTGSDIRENKKTLLRLLLFESSNTLEKKVLIKIFGNNNISVKEINQVRNLIQKKGINEQISRKLLQFSDKANQIIKILPYSKQNKNLLFDLLQYNMIRKK